ncbi:hypothetical protein KAR91_12955 [Candidatus Pacearchaeota archaeon]|nr:hypothetical protein [Candidatus Pacearchaeota archaeon]
MADLLVFDKDTPLQLSENKLKFNILSKIPAVKQSVKTRVQSFKTEFYLNVNFGVDWYGVVLNQGAQAIEQEAEINDMVRDTNGVQGLRASEVLRNAAERESVYLAEIVSDGQIVPLQLPFDFLEP